jgi:hypothetical protein
MLSPVPFLSTENAALRAVTAIEGHQTVSDMTTTRILMTSAPSIEVCPNMAHHVTAMQESTIVW